MRESVFFSTSICFVWPWSRITLLARIQDVHPLFSGCHHYWKRSWYLKPYNTILPTSSEEAVIYCLVKNLISPTTTISSLSEEHLWSYLGFDHQLIRHCIFFFSIKMRIIPKEASQGFSEEWQYHWKNLVFQDDIFKGLQSFEFEVLWMLTSTWR